MQEDLKIEEPVIITVANALDKKQYRGASDMQSTMMGSHQSDMGSDVGSGSMNSGERRMTRRIT